MAGVAQASGRAVLDHEGQTALANGIERGRIDAMASGVQQNSVPVGVGSAPGTGRGERRARILVVSQEPALTVGIVQALREAGYEVVVASNATPVRDVILDGGTYDLITLDAGLPGAQGFAVLKTLREWGVQTPVLLMSAADVTDTIRGLDLGADDVTAKPCAGDELKARVSALLRRLPVRQSSELRVADLTLDPTSRLVTRGGNAFALTGREYRLLEYFMRNEGRVLTRTMVLDHVWGLGFDRESNLVEVYVSCLRRKMDSGGKPRLIHTIRGVGYMLSAER